MEVAPPPKLPSAIAPIAIALLWGGALEWYRAQPTVGVFSVGAVFLVVLWWAYVHRQHLVSRSSFWLGVAAYFAATLGALSFIASVPIQHLIIAAIAVVAWIYLDQATHHMTEDLQGRVAVFVMTVTYFCAMLSLLNFAVFVFQPWWVVVAGGTVMFILLTMIVWLDVGIPAKKFRRGLLWMGWLGAEIALVAWWLPTSVYVSSVVATTMGMLMIHLGRHVWRDSWDASRGKRYVAIGLAVILLTILTARWF